MKPKILFHFYLKMSLYLEQLLSPAYRSEDWTDLSHTIIKWQNGVQSNGSDFIIQPEARYKKSK